MRRSPTALLLSPSPDVAGSILGPADSFTLLGGADNFAENNYLTSTSITFGTNTPGGAHSLALASISPDVNQPDAFGGYAGDDWNGGSVMTSAATSFPFPESSSLLWLTPLAALGFALSRRSARSGLRTA